MAASVAQLPSRNSATYHTNEARVSPISTLIASSPYLEPDHLLDLNSIDSQSQLLAIALTKLKLRTSKYAIVRYEDALDLDELLKELQKLVKEADVAWKHQDFYVVEFRSQLKQNINSMLLFKLDKESHREANISGGLLKYWFGEADTDRRNLATCECIMHILFSTLRPPCIRHGSFGGLLTLPLLTIFES